MWCDVFVAFGKRMYAIFFRLRFSHFMQTVKKTTEKEEEEAATEKKREKNDSLKCFASTAQSGYLANHVFVAMDFYARTHNASFYNFFLSSERLFFDSSLTTNNEKTQL